MKVFSKIVLVAMMMAASITTQAQMRFAENGTFNSWDPELKTASRIDHVFVSPCFAVERYGVLTNAYWSEAPQKR